MHKEMVHGCCARFRSTSGECVFDGKLYRSADEGSGFHPGCGVEYDAFKASADGTADGVLQDALREA